MIELLTKIVETASAEATEAFAATIGSHLKGGEVIELRSDLGGGKTTFVRGLAHGLGSTDRVASPTFTVSKVYQAGELELHHFDFYRLQEAGLMSHELHDLIGDPKIIVVVEWADVVQQVLPEDRLIIAFTRTDENIRQLTITYPNGMNYLAVNL
jgi:tRNA threonylcarbamoyladenosine biosynthesis protein TsaE